MGLWIAFFLLKCCNPVISFYSYEVSNKRKLFVGSLSRSSLAPVSFQSAYDPFKSLMCNVSNHVVFNSSPVIWFTKRKKGKDLVDYVKNKYGEENVLKEICPKCSKKFKCFSARIYENESGMMQCYAHFYIYLQIGVYSDLAMLCYYKVLFQNDISHMFYSNFPSFTPSINV